MYLPSLGSQFNATGHAIYLMKGGILANGNVIGIKFPIHILWWTIWVKNLSLTYDRNLINDFMQYSVNGGPLVIENTKWQTSH